MLRLKNIAKDLDSYGIPLGFTYNQKRTFTSYFGAFISVITKIGIIVYLGIICNQVIQRKLTTITTYEYYRDYFIDSPEFLLQRENFDLAVRMVYQGGPNPELAEELDTYFSVNFYTYDVTFVFADKNASAVFKAQGYTQEFNKFEKIRCPENRYGNETVGKGPNFTEYWCPKDIKDLKIQGTSSSNSKHMFMVSVEPCNQVDLDKISPGKQCKPLAEIYAQIPYLAVWVNIRSQYFDVTEFDKNPIKHSQKKWVIQVPQQEMQYQMFKVQRNIAQRQDNLFPVTFSNEIDEEYFYQIEQDYVKMLDFNASMKYQSACFFLQDEAIKVRKRNVFTFIDAFSKVGGVLGLVGTISSFVTSFFQHGLFIQSLFQKLYFQKPKYVNQGEDNISLLMNKKNISFTIFDQLLMKCRTKSNPKKIQFQKYLHYLRHELDIQSYILSLRKVNFLVDVILNNDQKKLMKYFLLNTSYSTSWKDDPLKIKQQETYGQNEDLMVRKCIEKCNQGSNNDKISQNILKMIYLVDEDDDDENIGVTVRGFENRMRLDGNKQFAIADDQFADSGKQNLYARGHKSHEMLSKLNRFKSDMTTNKAIKSTKTSTIQQSKVSQKNLIIDDITKPANKKKKIIKSKKMKNIDIRIRIKNQHENFDNSKRKLNEFDDENIDIFNH